MRYLGKKIITLIMTLFLVSAAAFLAFQIIPGDVVTSILGTEATPEREQQLREELGLDNPPVVRYFNWAAGVLKGDLGVSYRYSKNMNEMMPVAQLIGDKLPVTLWLAAAAFVLIALISIPLGVFWAKCASAPGRASAGPAKDRGPAEADGADGVQMEGASSVRMEDASGVRIEDASGIRIEDASGVREEDASGVRAEEGPSGIRTKGTDSRKGGRLRQVWLRDVSGRLYHFTDAALGVVTQAAMAVPSFFLGILVTFLFGVVLKLFAPGGYVSYKDDFWGFLGYLVFPAFSIAIPKIAMTARFLRNSMLTELKADYVRTAYSKGCTGRQVLYGHVLRNAMMPVVTFLGMIVAEVVAGSIVIEQVFGLPGIGRLLISSISTRDFPVVEILILYITFVVIFVYFIVDILYRVIDPRVSEK